MFGEALREMIEPTLACRCGAMNSPTLRTIRVDLNGVACCGQCGRGGDVSKFQPPTPKEKQP